MSTMMPTPTATRAHRAPRHPSPMRPAADRAANASPRDLLRAAARSEPEAWQQLVQRFNGRIISIARSYGLDHTDVADVTQIVWIRLFDHLDRVREPERVGAWLATTTRNECLHTLKRRRRVTPTSDLDLLDDVDAPDPLEDIRTSERHSMMSGMIEALPAKHRDLMRMLLLDPAPSYKVISSTLGIPTGSIGPIRQRSLSLLRGKCVAAGISRADAA